MKNKLQIYNVLKLGQTLTTSSRISVKIYANEAKEDWSVNSTTFLGFADVKGLPQTLNVICGPNDAPGPSKDGILRMLSVLDWTRPNQFEGIDNHFAPTLLEYAKSNGRVVEHDPIGLYFMEEDHALKILSENDLTKMNGVTLKGSSLHINDAEMVEDRWPEKFTGYLEMLQASIELCSSGGVYVKDDSDKSSAWSLVSFAVALPFGSIHAFHTEPDHRRKGYGKLTMKVLAKNIAEAGRVPLVQIFKDNDGSMSLNQSIGFKYSHDINLMHFYPL